MTGGAYLRLSAFSVVGTVVVMLLCAAFRSFIPFGLWILAFAVYQHRRGRAWFGNTTFERADRPYLFAYFVGGGYVIGLAVIAFSIYKQAVRAGAV